MKKKILLLIMFGILLLNLIPLTSAFFVKSHLYWNIKGMQDVQSPITELCSDKLDILLDGVVATDIPVLHYFDEQFMSYISTHTRGSGYEACLIRAGTDPELQCFCYGVGLHNIQDHFAHAEGGLVPKYLSKYFSSNLVGHMTVEKSYENKHMELVENSNIVSSGTLDYYNKRVLDNLFEEKGGSYKYLLLLEDMSGIDMRNDANIFASGYKGVGFYDTVYGKKLSLPWWFWSLSIGLIIIGFGVSIVLLIVKGASWKYFLIGIYLILGIIGILILVSFFSGNTWQWIQLSIMILPIRVSDSDISHYDNLVQQATNRFLATGYLPYDDNSGLTYWDSEGNYVEGALSQAEKKFQYILLPIVILLFIALNAFLLYKTFKTNK